MADVEEIEICPVCGGPLKLSEAVDYNGQSVHKECVPEGRQRDPNQSYT
jgi:hypothetical protein